MGKFSLLSMQGETKRSASETFAPPKSTNVGHKPERIERKVRYNKADRIIADRLRLSKRRNKNKLAKKSRRMNR